MGKRREVIKVWDEATGGCDRDVASRFLELNILILILDERSE